MDIPFIYVNVIASSIFIKTHLLNLLFAKLSRVCVQRNVMASGVIPQISLIMGPCAGAVFFSGDLPAC